jgi:asparagine synthase (glutamine-hydrolysing)
MYARHYQAKVQNRAEETAEYFYSLIGDDADPLDKMLYLDSKTWLPDDLLLKADKVTMGNSLELRVPLLDHKVMEFAASLPRHLKVRGRESKRVLRKAFSTVLPEEVLTRKKAGFPVPYAAWLAGPLLETAKELLLDRDAFISSFFDSEQINLLLDSHAEKRSHQRSVFSLIVLELWAQQFYVPPRVCRQQEFLVS